MSVIGRIQEMLRVSATDSRYFPSTMFYNEGWLLRLVLDWFSEQECSNHVLDFHPRARWFSEALLPTQFSPLRRPDPLAEGWTHADGVIGHVIIGNDAIADAKLDANATQFVVTEAKLFSPLSHGVKNAIYFDQAARNVACIAEVLFRAKRQPQDLLSLSFVVLAPAEQILSDIFSNEMAAPSIISKVSKRISEYSLHDKTVKELWLNDWFLPVLSHIQIACISWESVIDHIRIRDNEFHSDLSEFYNKCLKFNRVQERE